MLIIREIHSRFYKRLRQKANGPLIFFIDNGIFTIRVISFTLGRLRSPYMK